MSDSTAPAMVAAHGPPSVPRLTPDEITAAVAQVNRHAHDDQERDDFLQILGIKATP